MSADFWAGYISGSVGILVGNPLDIIKTKLQAGPSQTSPNVSITSASTTSQNVPRPYQRWTSFAQGAAAPILGYGALNALLFVTYNRSLALINSGNLQDLPDRPSGWSIWTAGALGGLAIFFVSAPTELVKCRAQVSQPPRSSLQITRELWEAGKVRGLYLGGAITSVRDAVGYGFYFWSYELSKRSVTHEDDSRNQQALKVLLCGGLAGVVTWASIFPLDVIKTRVQTWDLVSASKVATSHAASQPLLGGASNKDMIRGRPSSFDIAKQAYQTEGKAVFFRGLGVCSVRAFLVNAVQWAVYEWMMKLLAH
ncbi:related to ornithine transporter 2 [Ramularia collo-cygni]|uniref:Related to ornithine transporter 2 n=1 Tax=Ramularia collo-cygni TaxID=112498 RepID=A0A2D3UQE6_9PEZI|nr:related to ornithine transporter 2 [Ramularia collo-cygni]CZT14360.1 related to ornithine transporter 2 [Ramularia collo-cygni]